MGMSVWSQVIVRFSHFLSSCCQIYSRLLPTLDGYMRHITIRDSAMKLGNLKGSNTFRVLFIGFIILILLIPMGMVESVIFERGLLYQQANNEITASWGEELLISAPIISIPYMVTQTNEGNWAYETRYKH